MLTKPFFPKHEQNRMKHEGDVAYARQFYFKHKPSNLHFLLEKRFSWMNDYIKNDNLVVEIGAGPAFTKKFITKGKLIVTDYVKHPWVDQAADALAMPFEKHSIDVIISTHMIHHLAEPLKFFREMSRVLKPSGLIIIQEINTAFIMRLLLYMMKHEGYSYNVDVFDEKTVANDPTDAWSANCAIPYLLFHDQKRFEQHVPDFRIIRNQLTECLIFPLSGGVTSKTKTFNLPYPILKVVDKLDDFLIAVAPSIFALGRQVVLQKNSPN